MRLVPIASVAPGMRVAAPFFNTHGDILLRSGTVLTEAYLDLLRQRGAQALWIEDLDTDDITAADILTERTRLDAMGKVAGLLSSAQVALAGIDRGDTDFVRSYLQSPEFLRAVAALPYWDMAELVDSIIDEAIAEDPVAVLLSTLKTVDTYQFAHAVDSTVAAVILGARLKLDRGSLRRLVRGSLLHDLGMVLIDQQVVRKASRLDGTDRAQLEQHTSLGYELLSAVHKDDILANHIAFQHHERQDGSGYPRHLRGDNSLSKEVHNRGNDRIILLAEIAAVADVYDALTADRPYRPALASDVARLLVQRMAGSWLNAPIVGEFLSFVPPYPLATEVVVAEGPLRGYGGVVCKVDPKAIDRPVVRLLVNHRGERVKPFEIDLRRALAVTVRALPPSRASGPPNAPAPGGPVG